MTQDSSPDQKTLKCLDGQPAPNELVRRWRRYLELPGRVHAKIWEVLTPILLEIPQEQKAQHVTGLASTWGVEASDLSLAAEGCHALLLGATARGMDAADFDADLKTLGGEADVPVARAALIEGYDRASNIIRQQLVAKSVAEHGKVLTGLNWRIDRILSSGHGVELNTPILMMTLHYEDAGEKRHITFQMSDRVLKMVRDFCDKMLKLGAEATSEETIRAQELAQTKARAKSSTGETS